MTKAESKIVYIKDTKNGRGMFAKKNFANKEVIIPIKGELITCYEDDNVDEQTRSNTIRFDEEMFLSPKGELGELINHSCNPNAKIAKKNRKLIIIAIKPIAKDTEITFDYSTVLASDDVWKMKCNCKEKNCRNTIKRFNTLPKKTKELYIDRNIVPKYILAIK